MRIGMGQGWDETAVRMGIGLGHRDEADRAGAELWVHVGTWRESGWPHWQQDVNNLPGQEFFSCCPPRQPHGQEKGVSGCGWSGAGPGGDVGPGPGAGGSGDPLGLGFGVQTLIPWLVGALSSVGLLQPPRPWLGWGQEPLVQTVGTGRGATRLGHPVLSPGPPDENPGDVLLLSGWSRSRVELEQPCGRRVPPLVWGVISAHCPGRVSPHPHALPGDLWHVPAPPEPGHQPGLGTPVWNGDTSVGLGHQCWVGVSSICSHHHL